MGSHFLSDSFRGEPAAEKRLNELKLDASWNTSSSKNKRSTRHCVQVSAGRVDIAKRSSLSAEKGQGEGCPGMVGQVNEEKPQAVAKKTKAAPKKRKGKQSTARIREAASKVDDKDCAWIVKTLVESAKQGEVKSIKLLCSFAHSAEVAAESEDKSHLPSIAMALANSPQWTGAWPQEEHKQDDEGATDSQLVDPLAS